MATRTGATDWAGSFWPPEISNTNITISTLGKQTIVTLSHGRIYFRTATGIAFREPAEIGSL
jgi:hypothetical protein